MSDDLISKQAAIRWVKTECNPYGNPTLDYETGIKVINHLRDMPFAEPETGRWIPVKKMIPDNEEMEFLITVLDKDDGTSEVYKGFYQDGEWWTQWCHGCKKNQ